MALLPIPLPALPHAVAFNCLTFIGCCNPRHTFRKHMNPFAVGNIFIYPARPEQQANFYSAPLRAGDTGHVPRERVPMNRKRKRQRERESECVTSFRSGHNGDNEWFQVNS